MGGGGTARHFAFPRTPSILLTPFSARATFTLYVLILPHRHATNNTGSYAAGFRFIAACMMVVLPFLLRAFLPCVYSCAGLDMRHGVTDLPLIPSSLSCVGWAGMAPTPTILHFLTTALCVCRCWRGMFPLLFCATAGRLGFSPAYLPSYHLSLTTVTFAADWLVGCLGRRMDRDRDWDRQGRGISPYLLAVGACRAFFCQLWAYSLYGIGRRNNDASWQQHEH